MKTYVLVAGLIALLPHVDSQGKIVAVTALILSAEGRVLGEDVHPHEPLLGVYEHSTVPNPRSATLKAGTGRIGIDDPFERILDFDRLYPRGGLLRQDCITGDVQTKCLKANGKPALVGRVTLEGSWTVRPVDLDFNYNPRPDDIDLTTLGFLSYSPPHVSHVEGIVAGAVLFETTESVKLVVDGNTVDVKQVADCAKYHLGQDPCALVAIRNLPKSGGMPDRPRCGQRRGEVDAHFDLMYEVLDTKPAHRYVPFNQKEDVEACRRLLTPGTGDNPPRIKCPTTMMSPVAKP